MSYPTCRYLDRHGNRCTAEAADPDAQIQLCLRHLALALELINSRMETA